MNLIIHPEDPSTSFLKPIYEKIDGDDKIVVDKKTDPDKLIKLMEKSDRVLAMGHGCPNGLFSINMFSGSKYKSFYALDDNSVDALKSKDQNIYIWCHANGFVDYHNLKGFYSGMFISEVVEAKVCGLFEASQEMVDESNNSFSQIVGDHISLPKEDLYIQVAKLYGEIAKHNMVAKYNLERLFVK